MSPEAWLRGPVDGVIPELQPVAHSLIQALEDLERIVPMVPVESLWKAPGGAASPGFHLHHLAGSTDRLLSYARGDALDGEQKRRLAAEKEPHPEKSAEDLLNEVRQTFSQVLEHLRTVTSGELDEDRSVGSGGLPSNVRGLLYHIGEHATRHVGQLITTLNILRDRPVRGAESGARRHAPAGGMPGSPKGQ
jgi:hypothetical protein